MRANYASLAAFAGLAALVTGDSLPPDSIPIQCATICGPMVELTALCDVHNHNYQRRRRATNEEEQHQQERQQHPREWVSKLAVEPKIVGRMVAPLVGQTPHRPSKDEDDMEKRQFSVIRPAPTTFAPELVAGASLDLRPTSTLRRLNPIIVDPVRSGTATITTTTTVGASLDPSTSAIATSEVFDDDEDLESSTAPAPSASRPSSADPNPELEVQPGSSNSATTTVTLIGESNTLSAPPMEATGGKEQKGTNNGQVHPVGNDVAEEQCVCLNTSFDVAQVAALCASCIESTGDFNNNGQVIVDTCNFAPQLYTPSRDSIVNNIRVKAVRPVNSWNKGSSVDNTGAASSHSSIFAAGLAIGIASLLMTSAVLL